MKKAEKQRIIAQAKVQAGIERRRYFEEGGEMVRWRGLHIVQENKKKYTRKPKHRNRYA